MDSILYQTGQLIRLEVVENHRDPRLPTIVDAVIERVLTITMSPVLQVKLNLPSETSVTLVLKLYDRRVGTGLRKANGEHRPLTAPYEAAFQSFLRGQKMPAFLSKLQQDNKEEILPFQAGEFLDGTADGDAQYEATLWQKAEDHFQCETEAYHRMQTLQGSFIPDMYAQVRVNYSQIQELGTDEAHVAPYLDMKGILLEHIPGYDLWGLPFTSHAPENPGDWQVIVQKAVDAVHTINQRGILLNDCDPRNVRVDDRSQKPYIIDFAQCDFRDRLIKLWKDMKMADPAASEDEVEDGEVWDPNAEWLERVRQVDNTGAIGSSMQMRLRKTRGMEFSIRYPEARGIRI